VSPTAAARSVALGTPGLADLRRASRSGTGSRADIGRAEKPPDRGKKSNTAPNGDGQVLRRAGLSGVGGRQRAWREGVFFFLV